MKLSVKCLYALAPIYKSVYSQGVGGLAERLRSGLQIRAAKPTQARDFTAISGDAATVKKSRTLHERIGNPSNGAGA